MICVTIACGSHTRMIAEHERLAEEGIKLVELRLDFLRREPDLHRLIPPRPTATVITARRKQDGGLWQETEEKRLMLLRSAIVAEPEFVDLEVDIADQIPPFGKTRRIISYHNPETMPVDLEGLHREMLTKKPYFIKIAVTPNSFEEMHRFLVFVRQKNEEARKLGEKGVRVIGICMGEMGKAARILSKRFCMPYTYSTFSDDRIIAPGMLVYRDLLDLYHYDHIDNETSVFGIIGNPVGHSLSPLVHNRSFLEQHLNAVYVPFQIKDTDVADFIRLAPEFGLHGISVTIPHKVAVINHLTKAEAAVEKIGACNTVVFRQMGERVGYNTDYIAAITGIEVACGGNILDEESVLKNRRALVLGSGGAGMALAYGLVHRGAMVTVTDADSERAVELAKHLGCEHVRWDMRESMQVDIVVNCTPLGMYPKVDETPFSKGSLRSNMLVFDAVYNPEHTLLIKSAQDKGCKVVTGVEMFVGQACYQFKLFTGEKTSAAKMRLLVKDAIVRMNRG